ncbi:FAD-binding oxidoreductase [Streptomyces sp. NA04227]|uniref:FAD-binding oxidoreductase n=1 Tax=Streptomyces sp. NA04227 TaxID=2742136 RepID=UPI0015908FE1|nr:FAD-binding oxidoreductase [Streptomyces sp. NA04227]QKW10732.1 FAD-binding oxidoreductase [Streptomyces sp. NA04227]
MTPADEDYATELAGFQVGLALRPEQVWQARTAEDVVAAVAYAAREGLPVGVQATGHGLPDAAEGGVLISTRRMNGVEIDAEAATAVVRAGTLWGEVVEAAAPHGLAPLNGSSPGVGAVSYTLAGGLGILAREFGYAADHVHWLDVVTADAKLRRVTPDDDPDLYWALLGGGHNFGVVTALKISLLPVARLYGGSLTFDGTRTDPAAAVAAYEAWTRDLPETVTSSFAAVAYPDMPELPPHLRGAYHLAVRVAFTGSTEEGERLVAPLREIGPAVSDTLRELPYLENASIHSDPDTPHPYYGDSAVLTGLDTGAAGQLLAATGPSAPMMCVVNINHLGGALAREPKAANSVPHRQGRFALRVITVVDGAGREAAREFFAGIFAPFADATTGRVLNFSFAGGDRTEGLYPQPTLERLTELKERFDPANLFRRNHNLAR